MKKYWKAIGMGEYRLGYTFDREAFLRAKMAHGWTEKQIHFIDMTKEILERLEWEHGGDMIEYEFWRDPVTNKLYNVPIEIVRDFDNAEEVEKISKF